MFWNKYLLPSVSILLLIATLHIVFIRFYIYWIFRWSDIPIHILAGIWIVLTLSWILSWLWPNTNISFSRAIMWGLIIGGLWEIGELVIGINSPLAHGYIVDTLKDLVDDVIGAACGFFVMLWINKKDK